MPKENNIKQELKDLDSPLLAQWQGKVDEWSMSDTYLNQLTEEVIAQSGRSAKFSFIRLINKKSWQIAAGILFLMTAGWFFTNNSTTTQFSTDTIAGLDNISTEDIQAYVLDNIDDFDVELLENYALDNNDEHLQIEGALLEDQLDVDLF